MTKTAPPPRRPSSLAAPVADHEPAPGAAIAAGAYFALALIYFLPAMLPGRHIYGTDYLNAGYFFYEFVERRMSSGHLPGWVPQVYGGVPHFANPGSTYYPVLYLSELIAPVRMLLPLLFWVQFGLAGWGMYLLGREMKCRPWVAFVVGLAFQWTGILTSWVYAGHDGRIIVASLAPMLFFCLHRGIRTGRLAPFAGAALTVSCALLSFQIQNAWYLLLGAALWALFLLIHLGVHRDRPRLAKTVVMGIAAVAFGFVAASVDFLPFQEYVGQSPRGMSGGRGYEYSTSFSMPLRAVAGLAAPEQVGANVQNQEGEYILPVYRGENAFRLHTEYVGALVLVLFAAGIVYSRRNRYWLFFAGLGLFALTLSLGGNTPLYLLYYKILPGLKRFRAPDLAYYVLAFSLISMAAVTLERLAEVRAERAARRLGAEEKDNRLLIAVGAVVAIAVLAAMTFGAGSAAMAEGTRGLTPSQGWMRFAFFAALTGGALLAWWARSINTIVVMALLSLVTVADLWVMGKKFMQTVDGPESMYAEDEIAAFFRTQKEREGPFRVFPIPGQSAWPQAADYPMSFGIDQIGGEHGNQLQRYNEFAGPGERTYVDFHNLFRDPRFLAAANARYLVASVEFNDPMLRVAYRGQNALVYENLSALPRAYLAQQVVASAPGKSIDVMKNPSWDPRTQVVVEGGAPALRSTPLQGTARVTTYEPDRVVVQTTSSRPAMMVLADNWYADWHATVNGRPEPVRIANHTFRGVVVPQGNATVEFVFRPARLYTGFRITLACFALLALYGVYLLATSRRRRTPVGVTDDAAPGPA